MVTFIAVLMLGLFAGCGNDSAEQQTAGDKRTISPLKGFMMMQIDPAFKEIRNLALWQGETEGVGDLARSIARASVRAKSMDGAATPQIWALYDSLVVQAEKMASAGESGDLIAVQIIMRDLQRKTCDRCHFLSKGPG